MPTIETQLREELQRSAAAIPTPPSRWAEVATCVEHRPASGRRGRRRVVGAIAALSVLALIGALVAIDRDPGGSAGIAPADADPGSIVGYLPPDGSYVAESDPPFISNPDHPQAPFETAAGPFVGNWWCSAPVGTLNCSKVSGSGSARFRSTDTGTEYWVFVRQGDGDGPADPAVDRPRSQRSVDINGVDAVLTWDSLGPDLSVSFSASDGVSVQVSTDAPGDPNAPEFGAAENLVLDFARALRAKPLTSADALPVLVAEIDSATLPSDAFERALVHGAQPVQIVAFRRGTDVCVGWVKSEIRCGPLGLRTLTPPVNDTISHLEFGVAPADAEAVQITIQGSESSRVVVVPVQSTEAGLGTGFFVTTVGPGEHVVGLEVAPASN